MRVQQIPTGQSTRVLISAVDKPSPEQVTRFASIIGRHYSVHQVGRSDDVLEFVLGAL